MQKKMVVIPNPIDLSLPEPVNGPRSKSVVFVGRLHKQKNPELLLTAFSEFVHEFTEYTLHIFGQGELEEELKSKVISLGIEDKVVWHGFCKDVRAQIVAAGMYVLSSNYEGISNSMLEAMAMGIPVIATDCPIGGSAVYIENEINGIIIPVGGKDNLIEAMKKLAADKEFAQKISYNGAKVREKYPIGLIADLMMEAAGITDKRQ